MDFRRVEVALLVLSNSFALRPKYSNTLYQIVVIYTIKKLIVNTFRIIWMNNLLCNLHQQDTMKLLLSKETM